MKTILYVTDFSPNAEKALLYACELGRRTGAVIIALHVMDIPTIMSSPETRQPAFRDIEREAMDLTRNRLRSLCESRAGDDRKPTDIRLELRQHKSPTQCIVQMAGETNADVVVMGARGTSKLQELLMGSTTRKVMEEAPCPVLVVPYASDYTEVRNIAYATDLEEEDIEVIKVLTWIAGLFDARIVIVHVAHAREYTGEEEMMQWGKEKLLAKVSYQKLAFQLLLSNDIYGCLNSYITDNDIQLVAMRERKKRNLYDRWFRQDMVRRMAFHSTIPLLSINEECLSLIRQKKTENYIRI